MELILRYIELLELCRSELYDPFLADIEERCLEAIGILLRYNHNHDPHTGRFTSGYSINTVDKSEKSDIIKERSKAPITKITDKAIERVPKVDINGYTDEQCRFIQQQHKELLKYGMKKQLYTLSRGDKRKFFVESVNNSHKIRLSVITNVKFICKCSPSRRMHNV